MRKPAIITQAEEAREFFELLGRCIAVWANADDELFRIFRECFGPRYKQSAIIFSRIQTLSGRLDLTHEIVRSLLPQRPKRSGSHEHGSVAKWKEVYVEYNELLETRARLAHQSLGPANGPGSYPVLRAGEHERLRGKNQAPT